MVGTVTWSAGKADGRATSAAGEVIEASGTQTEHACDEIGATIASRTSRIGRVIKEEAIVLS